MTAWKTTLYRGTLPALGACSIFSIEHLVKGTCSWRAIADMMPNGARYIPATDSFSKEMMIDRWDVQRFEVGPAPKAFFFITPFTHFYMVDAVEGPCNWELVETSVGEVARFRVRNAGSKASCTFNMPTQGHTFGCPTDVGWLFRQKWEGCSIHESHDAYKHHCRHGGRYNSVR